MGFDKTNEVVYLSDSRDRYEPIGKDFQGANLTVPAEPVRFQASPKPC